MFSLSLIYKWLTPGIQLKRWLFLVVIGIILIAFDLSIIITKLIDTTSLNTITVNWIGLILGIIAGSSIVALGLYKLSYNLLAPYRRYQSGHVIDVVHTHSKRTKGLKLVAVGGGTGLPSVLRGLKPYTGNITAVVTVADDGGSSGRLRRDFGVLPPGDIRNNIAALADDESLMTKLFQYRFNEGDLGGHAFGNLFIVALAGVSGGLEIALPEVERVLNIQGRVLPATLADVNLVASVRLQGKTNVLRVQGESKISELEGHIEDIELNPPNAVAFNESISAILEADIIIIGPGSLYTSIIPNMLVKGIADALRATTAYKVYVCNVATQPGETSGFNVADHVLALEKHIGRGIFQVVLANNARPVENAGKNTQYVDPAPASHEILQRYEVRYTDLTDEERPWRHDSQKLAQAILRLNDAEKTGSNLTDPILING